MDITSTILRPQSSGHAWALFFRICPWSTPFKQEGRGREREWGYHILQSYCDTRVQQIWKHQEGIQGSYHCTFLPCFRFVKSWYWEGWEGGRGRISHMSEMPRHTSPSRRKRSGGHWGELSPHRSSACITHQKEFFYFSLIPWRKRYHREQRSFCNCQGKGRTCSKTIRGNTSWNHMSKKSRELNFLISYFYKSHGKSGENMNDIADL